MSTPNPPTRTGKLLIPPNREIPGGFFRNGMDVQVLGPDPEDPSRIIVLLEGQRKLSFDPKFVVVDRNSRGQKKGTVEEYLDRKLANFVL